MCAKGEVSPEDGLETKDLLTGYQGYARKKLESVGAKIWDVIEIVKGKEVVKGIILPRSEFEEEDRNVTLKLINGYNVGVELSDSANITVYSQEIGEYKLPEKEVPPVENLPTVSLLGTGGTIAARLDYRTGAVFPAFSPGELFTAIPELATICNLKPEVIYEVLSEDLTPKYWLDLARTVYNRIKDENVDGVVIGHGTDTMCFTGTALSFLLQDLPVPVILVGSQRSSDRPSSDAAINLINAVTTAA
ncbi:MAG: asparaginase domain-containing protein, partial [Candidatus Helarchaeota archaeon]